jgi:regulator of sirC expression with transglutaminase-like and TPR domain
MSRTLFQLLCVLSLALSVSLPAQTATRTWEFDLKTLSTYEVHVQHLAKEATVPRGSEASYSFQTRETTLKRDIPFYPKDDPHPAVVLIADITSPQKAKVVISGIPSSLLQQTRVYVIDGNSRYPYEWLDPGKNIDLKSAKLIRDILKQPEQEIDLARAKLTVDKLIDPTVDIEADLERIGAMVTKIKAMPGFGGSQTTKLQALRRYIYEPGEWNGFQPYQYDLDDPLGTTISHKLLPHYLASKKGNCVTMPFLFIILGQRLGIDVTASTAPTHVFVKAKDEATGTWYNLEATSGASPARDIWLRQQLPMTDQAVANGVYLHPLTKKETVALMAGTLTEYYVDQHEFEKVITVSDLILEYYPKDVSVMIRKANAYYDLLSKYYAKKYRSPEDIPARARGHYHYLSYNNRYWAAKAIELGWREFSAEEDERYLQSIKEAKKAKPWKP